MRLNYIHQEIVAGHIQLKYIDTNNQVADILTKALPLASFAPLRTKLTQGFMGIPIIPKIKIAKKKSPLRKKKVAKTNSEVVLV